MTWVELKAILKDAGFNAAYDRFNKPQKLPFVAYYQDDRNDFHADDLPYLRLVNGVIELYMSEKNPQLEDRMEEALEAGKIPYRLSFSDYSIEEKVHLTRWYINFIGGKNG